MGLSFVPVTIASLTGVERADAGVASGLINTSRQIGGAVGIAAVSAIAATSASNYADAHAAVAASSGAALDHGFQTALYVLTGLLVARRADRGHARQAGAGRAGGCRRGRARARACGVIDQSWTRAMSSSRRMTRTRWLERTSRTS